MNTDIKKLSFLK